MENVYYMRILTVFFILSILASYAFSQEKVPEVAMRYSRQANTIRLVLESDVATIGNAVANATSVGIKVNLPSAFELKRPPDFPFEIAKGGRSLFIKLNGAAGVKISRLSAPARIVFDIATQPMDPKDQLPSQGPIVSPGPQSPPSPPQPQPAQRAPQQQPAQRPQPQPAQKAPQPQPPAEKVHAMKTVVVDPGHGGYEYGIVSGSAREKDINLSLARDLGAALAKKGKIVFYTRRVDQSTSLDERISFSNSKNPDFFVSIHAGLSPFFAIYIASPEDQNADAVVRLYSRALRQSRYIAKSRAAALALGMEIKNSLQVEVVLRELPLPVLNSMGAPALLIEYPSLSSYASDKKLRDRLIASILKGIAVYEQQ